MKGKILKIVWLGCGHGIKWMAQGLKWKNVSLTTGHATFDDAMHSGHVRHQYEKAFAEFGAEVLPPGGFRGVISALSRLPRDHPLRLRLDHRSPPEKGRKWGVSAGNEMLVSLALRYRGDWVKAIEEMCRIYRVKGKIFPISLRTADIVGILEHPKADYEMMKHDPGALSGNQIMVTNEGHIDSRSPLAPPIVSIYLTRDPQLLPELEEAMLDADIIGFGWGTYWPSIIANTRVSRVNEVANEAVRRGAKIVYLDNVMAKENQTKFSDSASAVAELCSSLNVKRIHAVIVNDAKTIARIPAAALRQYWEKERAVPVRYVPSKHVIKEIPGDFLRVTKQDGLYRICHSRRVIQEVMGL